MESQPPKGYTVTATLAPWETLAIELRQRDTDPAYADTPILDAYARISVNPNTGETEKTDRQLVDILGKILRMRARLGEVHRDDNMSAWRKKGKRPGWNKLLARVADNAMQGVVCWHTDRLFRRSDHLEVLIGLGQEKGFIVESCSGKYSLGTRDGRLNLRIMTAVAQDASDATSERRKRMLEAHRADGIPFRSGPRPFGFPGKDCSPDRLIAEREAIRWAVAAHIDGKNLSAIGREWHARGLPTTNGNRFTSCSVRSVLGRASNAGLIAHDGKIIGRVLDTDDPPIITEAQFYELRAILASRTAGRPRSATAPLSGILQCSRCKTSMNFNGKTRGNVYRCVGQATRNGACGQMYISAHRADEWARTEAFDILSDPKNAVQMARKSAALANVETALQAAKADRLALAAKQVDGYYDLDEYNILRTGAVARIARLESERDGLLASGAGESARIVSRERLALMWDQADGDERRAILKAAFRNGISVRPVPEGQRARWVKIEDRLSRIE